MSDDGVEAEAYSHEKMRNLNSFYCLCAENLVAISEMVDVDFTKQFIYFL